MRKPKKLSRQRVWQIAKVAAGCCVICGKPRPPELAQRCRSCSDKKNRLQNEAYRQKVAQ